MQVERLSTTSTYEDGPLAQRGGNQGQGVNEVVKVGRVVHLLELLLLCGEACSKTGFRQWQMKWIIQRLSQKMYYVFNLSLTVSSISSKRHCGGSGDSGQLDKDGSTADQSRGHGVTQDSGLGRDGNGRRGLERQFSLAAIVQAMKSEPYLITLKVGSFFHSQEFQTLSLVYCVEEFQAYKTESKRLLMGSGSGGRWDRGSNLPAPENEMTDQAEEKL